MIEDHGKDILNFQITMTILLFSSALLLTVLIPGIIILVEQYGKSSEILFIVLSVLPIVLMTGIGIICFFQGIFNGLKVLNDKPYKYILSIHFLK